MSLVSRRADLCRTLSEVADGPEADMTMERAFSTLRPHNATRMFSTENVVVEVGNPLLTRNGGVKVAARQSYGFSAFVGDEIGFVSPLRTPRT